MYYCGSGHSTSGSGGGTGCSCPHHTVLCPEGLSQASTVPSTESNLNGLCQREGEHHAHLSALSRCWQKDLETGQGRQSCGHADGGGRMMPTVGYCWLTQTYLGLLGSGSLCSPMCLSASWIE